MFRRFWYIFSIRPEILYFPEILDAVVTLLITDHNSLVVECYDGLKWNTGNGYPRGLTVFLYQME